MGLRGTPAPGAIDRDGEGTKTGNDTLADNPADDKIAAGDAATRALF